MATANTMWRRLITGILALTLIFAFTGGMSTVTAQEGGDRTYECKFENGATVMVEDPAMCGTIGDNADTTTTTGGNDAVSEDEFRSAKCAYLESLLTDMGIDAHGNGGDLQMWAASELGVAVERIRVHRYDCSMSVDILDGFIVLGPNEGHKGLVTATVPDDGAIDSYKDASYTGTTEQIGANTVRATDGTVTATTMTFWFVNDETFGSNAENNVNDDTGGVSATPTANGEEVCMTGADLAEKEGWELNDVQGEDLTRYGGARVNLPPGTELPEGWEAVGDTTLDEGGVFSIYPPTGDCRTELGVDS